MGVQTFKERIETAEEVSKRPHRGDVLPEMNPHARTAEKQVGNGKIHDVNIGRSAHVFETQHHQNHGTVSNNPD